MTDDRSLERAARSWIEAGPTRAPDRVVEAALHLIDNDTTRAGLPDPVEDPPCLPSPASPRPP